MKIKYDITRLDKLISDLSLITGVDISVRDTEFNEICRAAHGCGLCSAIHKTERGLFLCRASDKALLEKCKKSRRPETDVCHIGLPEIGVPVIKNGSVLGYVLIGRIRGDTDSESVKRRAEALGISSDRFEAQYGELMLYGEKKLAGTVNVICAMTELILSENMMREEHSKLSEELTEYIDGNLHKKLSVDILCQAMHVSKNTLYEHFHYAFDSTVTDYITVRRIGRAKELLATTDSSLEEIVSLCGIGSYTYLFTLMKKYTGMTPSEYRKKYRTQ